MKWKQSIGNVHIISLTQQSGGNVQYIALSQQVYQLCYLYSPSRSTQHHLLVVFFAACCLEELFAPWSSKQTCIDKVVLLWWNETGEFFVQSKQNSANKEQWMYEKWMVNCWMNDVLFQQKICFIIIKYWRVTESDFHQRHKDPDMRLPDNKLITNNNLCENYGFRVHF